MKQLNRFQSRLIGLSVGVLLALLIWPSTSRLVRLQFALLIPTSEVVAPWSFSGSKKTEAARKYSLCRYHETALLHPDDFRLQFSDALKVSPEYGGTSSTVKTTRLRELTRRFPGRPSLYAAILRFASQDQVKIDREAGRMLNHIPSPLMLPSHDQARISPDLLAAFDRDAIEGERIDPENAYFPLMRSAGLFAAHRNKDALAALERASRKPNWIEYYSDEIECDWKLKETTFGTGSALPRMASAYSILFPHYSLLQNASRLAIIKAVESEKAGKNEDGLAIRDAVRRCGSLMLVQSTSAIGAFVGISMNDISIARPGGAPPIVDYKGNAKEELRGRRLLEYDAYLSRIGHKDKIARVHAQSAAGDEARRIVKYLNKSPLFSGPSKLALSWIAGIILLSNVLLMLALGLAAIPLSRLRIMRSGEGLPPSISSSVTFGILAGAIAAGVGMMLQENMAAIIFILGLLAIGSIVLALLGEAGWHRFYRMGIFALSMAGVFLLCTAFLWQLISAINPMVQFIFGSGETEMRIGLQNSLLALPVVIASAIPLLTLISFGLLSLAWRVPLSVGVIRGLRGCAISISCLLLLAYGILVPMLYMQETAMDESMKRTVQHEGRFIAELAGKQWPK